MNCHGRRVEADVSTAVLRQANLAVFYLPFTSFPLKLPNHFRDLAQSGCSNWMSSRQQSS